MCGIGRKVASLDLCLFAAASEDYHAPELFNFKSEYGHMMYGMFYKPHDLEVGRQYPTVMVVYGGPQVQLVTNAYKGHR